VHAKRTESDPLAVVAEYSGTHRAWLWRNVVVICWYGNPSAAASDRLTEMTVEIHRSLEPTAKLSYLHLITRKLTLPDAATRASLLDSAHRFADRTALSGVVVSGGGFWASAVRGFVTGIAVLAPRSLDLRVFGSVEQLVPWFTTEHTKRTGVRVDGDELSIVLAQAEASCADLGEH
jgi:hypothetical protein